MFCLSDLFIFIFFITVSNAFFLSKVHAENEWAKIRYLKSIRKQPFILSGPTFARIPTKGSLKKENSKIFIHNFNYRFINFIHKVKSYCTKITNFLQMFALVLQYLHVNSHQYSSGLHKRRLVCICTIQLTKKNQWRIIYFSTLFCT